MGRPVNLNAAEAAKYYRHMLKNGTAKEKANAAKALAKIAIAELGFKRTATIHENDEPAEIDIVSDPEPIPDPFDRSGANFHADHEAWLRRHPEAAKTSAEPVPAQAHVVPQPVGTLALVAAPVAEMPEIIDAINKQPMVEVAPVAPAPRPIRPATRPVRPAALRYWDGFNKLSAEDKNVHVRGASPSELFWYRRMLEELAPQPIRKQTTQTEEQKRASWQLPPMPPPKPLRSLTMTEALAPFAPCPPKGELPAPKETPRAVGKLRLSTPIPPPPDLTAG